MFVTEFVMPQIAPASPFLRLSNTRKRSAPIPVQRIAFVDEDCSVERSSVPNPTLRPRYDFDQISDVTCFVAGTFIRTPDRDIPVETLSVGDAVMTRDHGAQPIRWIGRTEVDATPDIAPIEFSVGALGNAAPLRVSPQHRMLLAGWRCASIAGTKEALAPAQHLINDRDIKQVVGGRVSYLHLAFDQHEIIVANGIASESFHPDGMALDGLNSAGRAELLTLFPKVGAQPAAYGPIARPEIKPYEARLIRP